MRRKLQWYFNLSSSQTSLLPPIVYMASGLPGQLGLKYRNRICPHLFSQESITEGFNMTLVLRELIY